MWRNDHQSVPAGKLSGTICLHNWWDIILQLRLNGSKHCRLPQGWNLAWCRGTLPMIWLIPWTPRRTGSPCFANPSTGLSRTIIRKGKPRALSLWARYPWKKSPLRITVLKTWRWKHGTGKLRILPGKQLTKSNATRGNPSNQHLKSYEWINHPGSTLFTF